jgi:hypothetical protein
MVWMRHGNVNIQTTGYLLTCRAIGQQREIPY